MSSDELSSADPIADSIGGTRVGRATILVRGIVAMACVLAVAFGSVRYVASKSWTRCVIAAPSDGSLLLSFPDALIPQHFSADLKVDHLPTAVRDLRLELSDASDRAREFEGALSERRLRVVEPAQLLASDLSFGVWDEVAGVVPLSRLPLPRGTSSVEAQASERPIRVAGGAVFVGDWSVDVVEGVEVCWHPHIAGADRVRAAEQLAVLIEAGGAAAARLLGGSCRLGVVPLDSDRGRLEVPSSIAGELALLEFDAAGTGFPPVLAAEALARLCLKSLQDKAPALGRYEWASMSRALAVEWAEIAGSADSNHLDWVRRSIAGAYAANPIIGAPPLGVKSPEVVDPMVRDCVWPYLWQLVAAEACVNGGAWPLQELFEVGVGRLCSVQDAVAHLHGEDAAERASELLTRQRYWLPHIPEQNGFGVPLGGRDLGTNLPRRFENFDEVLDLLASEASEAAPAEAAALLFAVTSEQAGFLANCGCAVTQSGGIPRLASALGRIRDVAAPSILIDVGCFLAPRFSEFARTPIEDDAMLAELGRLDYDVVVPGLSDLGRSSQWLIEGAELHKLPLTCANAKPRLGAPIPGHRVIERGGMSVAVIGLFEPDLGTYRLEAYERQADREWEFSDPLAALESELRGVPEGLDLVVLAGSISPTTFLRLHETELASEVDLVITGIDRVCVPLEIDDSTNVARVEARMSAGEYAGVAFMPAAIGRNGPTLVPVRVDSGGVVQAARYGLFLEQDVGEDAGVLSRLASLSVEMAGDPSTWVPSPLAGLEAESALGAEYVGTDTCSVCHDSEARSWLQTKHHLAMTALAAKGADFRPECLRCHTTGFLLPGGYDPSRAETVGRLDSVGCEVCHGPGHKHVQSGGATPMRVSGFEGVCLNCHDQENSPMFEFDEFYSRIVHK